MRSRFTRRRARLTSFIRRDPLAPFAIRDLRARTPWETKQQDEKRNVSKDTANASFIATISFLFWMG